MTSDQSVVAPFRSDHGWSLGENNEWGKHTAFRHSNHVPLLFRLPGKTGGVAQSYSENVDIFPTISELAGISVPPLCRTEAESASLALCTEGVSLAPLVTAPEQQQRSGSAARAPTAAAAAAAARAKRRAEFWQWPKMMIEKLPVMGYAVATDDGGSAFRYTEWVGYNYTVSGKGQGCEHCMNWTQNWGTEL